MLLLRGTRRLVHLMCGPEAARSPGAVVSVEVHLSLTLWLANDLESSGSISLNVFPGDDYASYALFRRKIERGFADDNHDLRALSRSATKLSREGMGADLVIPAGRYVWPDLLTIDHPLVAILNDGSLHPDATIVQPVGDTADLGKA